MGNDAGSGKSSEHPVIKTGVVRAGEKHEGRRREIAEAELPAGCESVAGGKEAVFFTEEEMRFQAGRGSVGVEEPLG